MPLYNSGQVCCAVKRVYAPAQRYDEVVAALAEVARSVTVGHGMDPAVDLGPLNNMPQLDIVTRLVSEAVQSGARVVTGGKRLDRPGYFFEPTIIADARAGLGIVEQEQFGPALPVVRYDDLDDALAQATQADSG
jgi:acyl-CoA reductase-like NAD-dependent aldehyde dehydrogenase